MLSFTIMILKGGTNMVDMYVALIIAGRRTLAMVPVKYQSAVHADLFALGIDDNGNPIEQTQ